MYNNDKKNIVIIQMANFQKITLIIAGILFIIMIIILSFVLFNANNDQQWPPIISSCPDYWLDLSGNGSQCVNRKGPKISSCQTAPDFTTGAYLGTNGTCQKYLWATTQCQPKINNSTNAGYSGYPIAWDGITYGVSNPCDASSNTT